MDNPFLDTLEVTGCLAKHVDALQSSSRTSLRVYKQTTKYCEADLFKFVPKFGTPPRVSLVAQVPEGI